MASAKDIHVAPIKSSDAKSVILKHHYSGRVVNTSKLHFGVFLNGRLEGAMSFGNSMKQREMIPLVHGTSWTGAMELNRMAFSDLLPRNSESRAISIAFKIIKKHYKWVEWIVSFSDGCQCGDGTIYRAAGFQLVGIKRNKSLYRLPDGRVVNNLNMTGKYMLSDLKARGDISSSWSYQKNAKVMGAIPVNGFQLKYIYFLNPDAKKRLTVPIIPFSRIDEMGAGMYRGKPKRVKQAMDGDHSSQRQGGTDPHAPLDILEANDATG